MQVTEPISVNSHCVMRMYATFENNLCFLAACNQRPSKALGLARLSIIKLFKSLIDTNTYTINATLAQIRTLHVLTVS